MSDHVDTQGETLLRQVQANMGNTEELQTVNYNIDQVALNVTEVLYYYLVLAIYYLVW